jgi:hypothetical protein
VVVATTVQQPSGGHAQSDKSANGLRNEFLKAKAINISGASSGTAIGRGKTSQL